MVALHANHAPERFMPILQHALQSSVEITLPQLLQCLDLESPDDYLEAIQDAIDYVGRFGLELQPSPLIGSFEEVRLLRRRLGESELTAKYFLEQITGGECGTIEFKETLQYDVKKALHAPGRQPSEYRSEEVLHSTLKTIAAFLNTNGGALFIGVCDDGTCKGIERDYDLLDVNRRNQDGWELELRNQIMGKFHDGITVSNYFSIDIVNVNDFAVARIRVLRRARMTFLKTPKDKLFKTFVRQGNNTRELDLWELEDYVGQRNPSN